MTDCIDNNVPVFEPLNFISDKGTYTLNSIDSLTQQFEQSFVHTEISDNPITKIINAYGAEDFYNSVREVNVLIFNSDFDFTDFPNILDRLSTNIILTPLEVARFLLIYSYTPNTLVTNISANSNKVIFELDAYYSSGVAQSTIGAFCSLVPKIFAAVDGFFDALDSLKSFISKIQNFSLVNLLSNLKKQVLEVFDKIIDKVKSVIENFSIASIVGRIEAFVNENIIARAKQLKEEALRFFSEENIKKIKDKISALIDYTTGVFQNPTLDEIQYIIYRFCGLASQVESAISNVQAPLNNYANDYNSVYSTLAVSSNQNTVRAIRAGAIRYEPQARRSSINTSTEAYTAAGNPGPIAVEEVEGVTSWNGGRGDAKISFGPGLQTGAMGEEGWTRVDVRARVLLMRVQNRFGRKLQVNSGYRSPSYNARIGGARNSYHSQGKALDITWAGFNSENRNEFIRISREEGFKGIGTYGSFVHVDIGPERSWNG
jgi:hypothetical protein